MPIVDTDRASRGFYTGCNVLVAVSRRRGSSIGNNENLRPGGGTSNEYDDSVGAACMQCRDKIGPNGEQLGTFCKCERAYHESCVQVLVEHSFDRRRRIAESTRPRCTVCKEEFSAVAIEHRSLLSPRTWISVWHIMTWTALYIYWKKCVVVSFAVGHASGFSTLLPRMAFLAMLLVYASGAWELHNNERPAYVVDAFRMGRGGQLVSLLTAEFAAYLASFLLLQYLAAHMVDPLYRTIMINSARLNAEIVDQMMTKQFEWSYLAMHVIFACLLITISTKLFNLFRLRQIARLTSRSNLYNVVERDD